MTMLVHIFIMKGFRIELSSRTHGVTVIDVGSLSFLGDNHLEVACSILTAGE